MVLKVFLDLEDTVINTWHDAVLLPMNVRAINEWLSSAASEVEVHIFSFAIWDEADKQAFVESGTKQMLERELVVGNLVEWLSVSEMRSIVETWSGYRFTDRLEFMQAMGKHDAFTKVCLARERDCRCVLIDDAVPDRTIVDRERSLTIDLLPIHTLMGQPPRFNLSNI